MGAIFQLIESGNKESLVNEMQEVFDKYTDFNRQQIAENAGSRFNYEVIGKKLDEIYLTVIHQDITAVK